MGGLRLTVTRLALLVIMPILVMRLARLLSTGKYRFVLSDLFVPLTGVWMFLAVTLSQGADMALAHAGPEVLEICIGYMATRVLLTEHGQALSFAKLLSYTIAVVALLGPLDPLTGHVFIHDWVNKLTGYAGGGSAQLVEDLYRHGLLRARGPLEQPLLFGLACCIGLVLACSIRMRARALVIIACGIGLLSAAESSPILASVLGMGLLLYDRILARVSVKWSGLIGAAITAICILNIVSDNPSTLIIRYFTLDSQTGYFRLWTWGLATELLRQSPWAGLGFIEFSDKYWLPTIDNMWLMFAILYGYPGSTLLFLSMLGAMSLPAGGPRVNLTAAELKLATTFSIILFLVMLVAYTVHIWGSDRILMGLLIGVRAHLGALDRLPARVQPDDRFALDLAPMSTPSGPVW